jgi:4-aminobutyrate aminotransferase
MHATSVADPSTETTKAGYKEHHFQCSPPYYDEPLAITKGQGIWVTDAEGRQFLDFFAGILTTGVGHCHPEVVAAVQDQVATLGHTSTLYLTENHVEYARRLASIAPGRLSQSFFTNSGTEAVETAAMLACMYTGRTEIVALRYSYSGRSFLTSNFTGHAAWRPLTSMVPGVKHVSAPYSYRCNFKSPCDDSCVEHFARELEETIQTTTSGKIAAFIAETVLGVGGYIVPPPGYFERMSEVVHKYGGLFICDEVQSGFGRTGDKWFGIQHWNAEPDIMVMAKAIASGLPLGATITRPEIAAAWTGKTISTFGGNPISTAAAIATNEVMVRENTPARSAARGAELRASLEKLQQKHEWIGDVRGMGLMQALEIVDDRAKKTPGPRTAKLLLEASKEERILVGLGGLNGHIIRFGPSMLITEDEMNDALGRLERSCARVQQQL